MRWVSSGSKEVEEPDFFGSLGGVAHWSQSKSDPRTVSRAEIYINDIKYNVYHKYSRQCQWISILTTKLIRNLLDFCYVSKQFFLMVNAVFVLGLRKQIRLNELFYNMMIVPLIIV